MTTTDISPEAVERLACILEGRGGFVKDSTITVTLRALSAALTQSRAETAAAYERAAEAANALHPALSTPATEPQGYVEKAANDAREVFSASCDHTKQAIDYMEQVLLALARKGE